MVVFCFLFIPALYLLYRNLSNAHSFNVGAIITALVLGSIVALLQFFNLPFIANPGLYGFKRWLSGFVDVVALPAILPLLLYFIAGIVKRPSHDKMQGCDMASFALLFLIPGGCFRAVSWGVERYAYRLVLVPFLWGLIALAIPFYLKCLAQGNSRKKMLAVLAMPFLTCLAVTSWWLFFAQEALWGWLCLLTALACYLVPHFLPARH
jgi:dolichol kinase